MVQILVEGYNYWVSILLMMIGFYAVITRGNLIKKVIGLAIFQVSVLLLYTSVGYVKGGAVPIITESNSLYVNPLPHVLMLTAIVVGVSVMAVALAIIIRIKEEYGSIEEDEILAKDQERYVKERESDDIA